MNVQCGKTEQKNDTKTKIKRQKTIKKTHYDTFLKRDERINVTKII